MSAKHRVERFEVAPWMSLTMANMVSGGESK